MAFILDTNICSAHLRGRPDLFSRLIQYGGRLYVTTINVGELMAWGYVSKQPQMLQRIEEMLSDLQVLNYDRDAAEIFGRIRGQSIQQGTPVSAQDLMIAAIALQHDFTIVTHNSKDFAQIPGVKLEDWLI